MAAAVFLKNKSFAVLNTTTNFNSMENNYYNCGGKLGFVPLVVSRLGLVGQYMVRISVRVEG